MISLDERLRWLDQPGVVASYTDRDGDLVVQHDGAHPDKRIFNAVDRRPNRIERIPGGITAQTAPPTDRHRPIPAGVSHGAQDVTAGTTGILVTKNGDGPLVDTNLHVAGGPTIRDGEPIDQPGEHDQHSPGNHQYGELAFYVDLTKDVDQPWWLRLLQRLLDWLTGRAVRLEQRQADGARHDAALVRPTDPSEVTRAIHGVDVSPERIEAAPIGTTCQKAGRTTGQTELVKDSDDWAGIVQEPWGPVRFVDQHLYTEADGPTSKGGDSGSTILWDDWRAVDGRLFAGNARNNITIANPYPHFADTYNVELY